MIQKNRANSAIDWKGTKTARIDWDQKKKMLLLPGVPEEQEKAGDGAAIRPNEAEKKVMDFVSAGRMGKTRWGWGWLIEKGEMVRASGDA